jgi:4'-phosphopantetheinyl transferase
MSRPRRTSRLCWYFDGASLEQMRTIPGTWTRAGFRRIVRMDSGDEAGVHLAPGEVHVWTVDPEELCDPGRLQLYLSWLSASERERRARFAFERDRHTFLVSRALVRSALSLYRPVDPATWEFLQDGYGRPAIAGPQGQSGLHFNLSHTEGMVACAIGAQREIGIDVENIERSAPAGEIARYAFAASEREALAALPEPERRRRFFEIWTLKEAYIKARGLGLAIPLDSVCFDLSGRDVRVQFDPAIRDSAADWHFELFRSEPAVRMALAVRTVDPGPACIFRWNFLP